MIILSFFVDVTLQIGARFLLRSNTSSVFIVKHVFTRSYSFVVHCHFFLNYPTFFAVSSLTFTSNGFYVCFVLNDFENYQSILLYCSGKRCCLYYELSRPSSMMILCASHIIIIANQPDFWLRRFPTSSTRAITICAYSSLSSSLG